MIDRQTDKKTITWSRREDGIFKAPLFFVTAMFYIILAVIFGYGSVNISVHKILTKQERGKGLHS